MTPDQLYSVFNLVAAIAWVLLAALPRVKWIATTLTGIVVPLIFAVAYAAIVGTTWWSAAGSFSTLAGVMTLFTQPWLVLGGWLHYLAFDLLIGSWEVRDARKHGIPHLLVVPCLFFTFMFGPVGWLAYRLVRISRATA